MVLDKKTSTKGEATMKTLIRWCGYTRDEYYEQCVRNPYGGYPDWEELELTEALDDPDCEWEEA